MGFLANIIAGLVGSTLGQAIFGSWGPQMAGMAIVPSVLGAVILVLAISFATSGSLKNRHDLYKDFKNIDTNRYNIDTQKLDFSTAQFSPVELEKQNKDLVNHANDFLKTAFSDAIMAALYPRDEDYKRQKQERGLKRYRVGNDEEETTTSNPQSA